MSDLTPFDCRANHQATFKDISPVLLEDHLRKTGSKLAKLVRERSVEEILGDMQLLGLTARTQVYSECGNYDVLRAS